MPVELEGVAAYGMGAGGLGRRGVHLKWVGWLGFGLAGLAVLLGALLIAGGAGASVAEPGESPCAAMAVLPVDFQALAFGEEYTHFFRSDGNAGEWAILR